MRTKYSNESCLQAIAFSMLVALLAPALAQDNNQEQQFATFAGGCFWCLEPAFDKLDGVLATISGYTGGHAKNPTYKSVSGGNSGHVEALQVTFDPRLISYSTLLETFWKNIDPSNANGQFCDQGAQYRTVIFYHNAQQQQLAMASKQALIENKPFSGSVVTEITAASVFYPAEEYHQDYYQKNPLRYKYYRYSCGRDQRLTELWGAANAKPATSP